MTSKRLNTIDYIKALAILLVIIEHHSWTTEQRLIPIFPYFIDMAVPIFMVLSGYVFSLSFNKRNIITIQEAYNYKNILDKLLRFIIPFTIIYLFEVILDIAQGDISIINIVVGYFTGGYGQGSYYFPLMIQFVFLFPLIFFIIKKYDFIGFVGCGLLNLFYEFIKKAYGMPVVEYRLIVLRYIFLIALGCYIYMGKKEIKKSVFVLSFIAGVAWIYLLKYAGYEPLIINAKWGNRTIFSTFYLAPFMFYILKGNKLEKLKCRLLETIGKASFNIYLVQMAYYGYFSDGYIYNLFTNNLVIVILNILICVTIGVLFYEIENKLTKKIINYLKEKDYFKDSVISKLRSIEKVFVKENS